MPSARDLTSIGQRLARMQRELSSGLWPTQARDPVARALLDRRAAIVARFLARLQETEIVPSAVLPSERIDNIHAFLGEIALALDGGAETIASARQHGSQRVRVGVDLGTMIREYGLLHDCVLEGLGDARPALGSEQDQALRRYFHEAMAEAAMEHAKARDDELRAAREEVVAIVAHDLRTPIGVVDLNAKAVARLLARKTFDRRRVEEHLEGLARATKRLDRLVADLLDLSRVEAGRLPIVRSKVAAAALVDDAIAHLAPLARSAGVELTAGRRAEGHVSCDRDRVLQVLSNLVGNSIKFTARGGAVTVSADAAGELFAFSVSDTGEGIAAEHLAHVFDRYWQAHDADGRGAGLGLAIAKGIVEAHGGTIRVESTPGIGTTFTFTLPAAI